MTKIDPNQKISVIKQDAIITIKVSGAFYQKIQRLLFETLNEKVTEPQVIAQTLKELESREPNDFWEARVVTYMALGYAIEDAAKKQKVTDTVKASELMSNEDDPSEESSPES